MGSPYNGYLCEEIFGSTHNQRNDLFMAPERPNHQLEVKLRLVTSIGTISRNLADDLNRDGMRITPTDQRDNVITVTGTPPDNGYTADSVLAVVRGHDNGAQIVSYKVLS